MYPILFRSSSYIVYSYTVALVVGMLAGTWMAWRLARERFPAPELIWDAGFWALLGGVIGGRAGYVIANGAYFVEHPGKAFAFWDGGLAWHGALIGGCAAIALWLIVRKGRGLPVPDWPDLFDAVAPGLALGGAFTWLGCLLSGCAYGAEASGYAPPLSWLTADLPDIYGVSEVRFLTQPVMTVWCLLLTTGLVVMRRRLPRGLSFALYLLLYALADLGVAFLRGDGTWRLGLWLGQWVAVGEIIVAVGLLLHFGVKLHKKE